ncbi:MAG TPA: lysozyme inhibitor LprI family protein [Pseudolabrys sp.]|jgi:uncharacterized protein YecT (DUF1311 family)
MRRALALAVIVFWAAPALAQDKPTAKDSAAIQKCIKAKTARHWAWERCIGIVSEPCAKDEGKIPPSEVIACEVRERAVWDDILNKSYQALLKALDEDQQVKLREMQRAWIASRDKNCEFLYDYFQGTMANPMIAACLSRATGMQALYLRGFADDVADRK